MTWKKTMYVTEIVFVPIYNIKKLKGDGI